MIATVPGVQVPLVLRQNRPHDPTEPGYLVVGESYIHGIMDGEMMDPTRVQQLVLY